MNPARILITGGKGMLASAMVRSLRARGVEPVVLDHVTLDITDPAAVTTQFVMNRPTVVLNCAAYTNVDRAELECPLANAINGYGVANLARACRDHVATLIHFSTDYVFDGTIKRPLRTDDPVGPVSAYGKSKLLGERLLQENAPGRWMIIRTAWLYGPNGPSFPATIVKLARDGKPLKVVDDQFGSPTFTHDLADATLNLLDHGAQGIHHVTNSGETNWHDFAAAILEELSLRADLSRTTSADWKKLKPDSATRPAYSVLDLTGYETITGKSMPPWRDALHRYRESVSQVGP